MTVQNGATPQPSENEAFVKARETDDDRTMDPLTVVQAHVPFMCATTVQRHWICYIVYTAADKLRSWRLRSSTNLR